MIYISHRGNITGPNPARENSPDYINEALESGFNVEVDVWENSDGTFLGHDEPQYQVSPNFLKDKRLWCHAKNALALQCLLSIRAHVFWHQTDDYTITSKGWIWAYPGKISNKFAIAVLPEMHNTDVKPFGGICSDYIRDYR